MQIKSAPPTSSHDNRVLNVSVSSGTYKVYYHQLHIIATTRSDYIHNTFSAFFNMLKQSIKNQRLHPMLRGKVDLNDWDYEYKKVKSRKAHVLFNHKLGIMMYRYSLQKDAPVMVRFLSDEFSTGDNVSVENIVIVISKNYENNSSMVSIHFVGGFGRLNEFLDILSDLTHRYIDFTVLEFRPVRAEFFVRYDASLEERVAKMIYLLYKRFGYDDIQYLHNKNDQDVYYLKRAHIMFSGIKIHIKTYRRKDYNDPVKYYYDNPKLELAIYFDSDDTLEDAVEKLNIALEFFGSFISVVGLDDYLIYEDHFQTTCAPVNDKISELLVRESLKLTELYSDIIKDEIDMYLLEFLSNQSLKSNMIKDLADAFGVSIRTLQRRLQKLEQLGIIEKKRVKKQQYVYTVKTTATKHVMPAVDYNKIRSIVEENKVLDIDLSNDDLKIMYYVSIGYVTTSQLSRVLKMRKETIRYHLRKLQSAGLIRQQKVGKSVKYVLTFSL